MTTDERSPYKGFPTRHFAITLDESEVPELLRRVATTIESIDATASVYFGLADEGDDGEETSA